MLHPCMNVHESFRDALLHPYESAEALCRRRNKVSTAAEWQVVWADSRWHVSAMMSNGVMAILMVFLWILINQLKP